MSTNINIKINADLNSELKRLYGISAEKVNRTDVQTKKKTNQVRYWKITHKIDGSTMGYFLAWIEDGQLKTQFKV